MSELHGLDQALKALNDMAPNIIAKVARKGMKQAADLVEQSAKNNLMAQGAFDTGELYKSIKQTRVRSRRSSAGLIVKIVAAFYGRFVEFGFIHHSGKNQKRLPKSMRIKHAGKPRHIAARPWLVPAMQANEQKVIAKIGGVIKEEVDKITRGRVFSGEIK